ncbi:putative Response regulator containing CheY-like receiver, AAA-type ATPase, and DNA-binding domains [Vibrio nigripulchritudo MADA3029]|uniref:sigma-54-dependent transcriptional regulator n=1 Tax=Vibrio nigripulchritudo TaxID=28173 RepID=UPI0003B1B6FB|nr:sigma-54 dependent transcriptional regulator [Vibrio nigripulchritudo]CCN50097.1 putative Response regulator containing CheY-like receiver, AAA-type ATPase, and DNA-binding domains [Vibrio nigripulchritudo MADA3020]CCN54374.1 putative Response regulator containing CheY-like receiver, AAA-type ATPase, and DNA-binding domains [Vibrio nigripulchritudo MADA3021]CCN58974.1 putative Response regulator containing CheY-like receiver, AAA-type ATPase, and DNA-binding domains [Vibrio nigripulchritudo M
MIPNKFSVLMVDDDKDVLDSYAHLMSIANLPAKCESDSTKVCQYIDANWAGVVIVDMYMPKLNGMELLTKIKAIDPDIPVIVITGHGDIPMAVDAVKKGASDFLEKPIDPPALLELIHKQLNIRKSFIEQKQNIAESVRKEVIGQSPQMVIIKDHIAQLSLLKSHLVISGESGCGRRSLAHLVHQLSSSSDGTYVQAQGNLIDSKEDIDNLLERSCSGTLVVTNIHESPVAAQQYLTQELLKQERTACSKTRLIGIFNEDPEQWIRDEKLHPELYYLLSQGKIDVPPLRKRPDDIAILFHYFLKQSCNKLGKPLPNIDNHYLNTLRNHHWSGNVRELKNVAELYAIGIIKLTGQDRLAHHDVLQTPLDDLIDDYEKQVIEDALFLFSGKVTEAANHLQVPRKKLYLRMKKHGIEKDKFKSRS